MTTIDYCIIALYLLVVCLVGLWGGRNIKDLREYAVAHRSYGAFVLMATLSASFIGGGFSFGNADKVFSGGLIVSAALWGFSLMLILVATYIAPKVEAFRDCISTGDILAKQLGKEARILAGVLGSFVCTGILAAQIGAIGAIFSQFTSLSFLQSVFLGCSIVIVYTAFGGMKAVVMTDVIQFLLLIVFIPVTFFLGVEYLGGFETVMDTAPERFFALPEGIYGWTAWIGLFLSFVIGETLVPPYVQRLLIAKNAKATQRGIMASGIISIPFFILTGAIGLLAFLIDADIPSKLAMPMVIEAVLPVGLKALAAAAIISVVMSSADSFLNAGTVCLIEDVFRPLAPKSTLLTPKYELRLSKLLTLFLGAGAVFLALKIENVLDVLLFAYNFWAPVILIPLVCILMQQKVAKRAFWLSACVGFVTVLGVFVFFGGNIFGIDALIIAVFLSGSVFLLENRRLNKV